MQTSTTIVARRRSARGAGMPRKVLSQALRIQRSTRSGATQPSSSSEGMCLWCVRISFLLAVRFSFTTRSYASICRRNPPKYCACAGKRQKRMNVLACSLVDSKGFACRLVRVKSTRGFRSPLQGAGRGGGQDRGLGPLRPRSAAYDIYEARAVQGGCNGVWNEEL